MDRHSIAQFRTATEFVTPRLATDLSLHDSSRKPAVKPGVRVIDELKIRRQMLGWSVKDVAERCEIEESALADWECGGSQARLDVVERWAVALGMRIALVPADSQLRRGLKVDWQQRRVTVDGTQVRLTPMEWKALERLARTPGEVVTHQALFHHLYGDDRHYRVQSTAIRVLITKLRRLLPLRIEAQWGKGYVVRGLEPAAPPTPINGLIDRGDNHSAAGCTASAATKSIRFDRPLAAPKAAAHQATASAIRHQVIAIAEPRTSRGAGAALSHSPCRAEELGVIERFLAERGVTRCPDVASIQQSPLPTLVWDKVKRKWVRPAASGGEAT